MRRRRANRVAVGALAAAAVAGLLLWPELPERMAIHWGSSGTPDNYVSKPVGVLGLPALGVAAVAVTRLAPDRATNTPGGENVAILFVAGVIAVVQGAVYAWNLGYRFDVWLVTVPVLAAAAALVAFARKQ
ncbi:MAG: DUF1648 domain-containing protein [Halobacterium sp.]